VAAVSSQPVWAISSVSSHFGTTTASRASSESAGAATKRSLTGDPCLRLVCWFLLERLLNQVQDGIDVAHRLVMQQPLKHCPFHVEDAFRIDHGKRWSCRLRWRILCSAVA
jgi:hypothetical protein